MSKLFNIQDGGGVGDEMNGGEADVLEIPFSTSGENIVNKIIDQIDDSNFENLNNFVIDENEKNKDKDKDKIDEIFFKNQNESIEKWKERMKIFINNNSERNQGQDGKREKIYNVIQKFLKNEKTNANTIGIQATGTATEQQPATQPQAPPATQPQAPPARECIHIGIIDETGTFVGVKSIYDSEENRELLIKLKKLVSELKATNEKQIKETQSVATIYDKFVENTTPANCVPTFIKGYETKFFNSDELKTLFEKADAKDVPFIYSVKNSVETRPRSRNGSDAPPVLETNTT